MKRLLQFIMLFFAIVLVQACEGPEGETGPQGEPGPQGATGAQGPPGTPAAKAKVFEFSYPLNAETGHGLAGSWTDIAEALEMDVAVSDSDAVLVYMFGGVDDEENPTWTPLPQVFFVDEGLLKLGFRYSISFLEIFMDADFDLATVTRFDGDYFFRVVIIPGSKLRTSDGRTITGKVDLEDYPINFNNYEEVANYFKLPATQARPLKLK